MILFETSVSVPLEISLGVPLENLAGIPSGTPTTFSPSILSITKWYSAVIALRSHPRIPGIFPTSIVKAITVRLPSSPGISNFIRNSLRNLKRISSADTKSSSLEESLK